MPPPPRVQDSPKRFARRRGEGGRPAGERATAGKPELVTGNWDDERCPSRNEIKRASSRPRLAAHPKTAALGGMGEDANPRDVAAVSSDTGAHVQSSR
jgi:hypothetical protein